MGSARLATIDLTRETVKLTLVAGLALLAHPLFASGVLTILLGIKLFLIGLIMVTAGSAVRTLAKK
jgi:uncharacterized membrane protein HdeD (DUF308 family)